jgi:3-oxoacyl-[acyl-carrier-protein] synthase-3
VIGASDSDVAIIGVGAAIPERILTNDEISQRVETDDAWIRERTGIAERRIAADDQTVTDLAIIAARQAVERADIAPAEIDLILTATASPERSFPSISALVADDIGAHSAGAIDMLAACAGFAYALSHAIAQINSGMATTVMVIGAEVLSRITDWDDRGTCILFGDGAGAIIVRKGAAPTSEKVVVELGVDGSKGFDLYGDLTPRNGEPLDKCIRMNGNVVYRFATQVIVDSAKRVLDAGGYTQDDIDLFVPHQANLRIIEAVAKYAGVPMERVMLTVQKYANMSAATVPVALTEALEEGRVKPGALLLMPAFGGGLTYNSLLVRWGQRVTPLGESARELPPCQASALELVNRVRATQDPHGRSRAGLMAPEFAEAVLRQ